MFGNRRFRTATIRMNHEGTKLTNYSISDDKKEGISFPKFQVHTGFFVFFVFLRAFMVNYGELHR